ncbi:transketolase [candidate division WWE3 bacterium RIFCSPHIGHO2_01_FULL_40_23]|uniref:Transketolase n=1 Tax=candidate division WWE3 bacterium RIFCSPLOWO2_01_FULL_41_18 TaxID=1802625 RepID=A0A1F4VEY8_UNCKA|nr:MAG: transketolase [candidate division WWE3 bacterium RIFCSPHIGHO2_01_FULL_40_23]OGC55757.1 MAG: transketolase [candidate division WWE3 bacterium RIFCSPLOWO2_01_FULL_41_18]
MQLAEKLFDINIKEVPTRDGFGEGLLTLGDSNPDVVVLCGDLVESTRSEAFSKKFPDRFFEIGVAEQNMMGMAAGFALSGKIPFISSYAVFNPGRNWDQLRVSVCYSNANVKVVGAHAGISVGPDGATHQGLEDMAITRVLPNLLVVAPCDSVETKKATIAIANHKGPCYIRFAREKTPVFTTEETPFELGKAYVFREGKDATIVSCGPLTYEVLKAANELYLERSISCEVIHSPTIKPLDVGTIVESAKKTKAVLTVEEHQITGGLGGAVCEALSEHYPVKVKRVGMPDTFGESGQPKELLEKYGMSSNHIKVAIRHLLNV